MSKLKTIIPLALALSLGFGFSSVRAADRDDCPTTRSVFGTVAAQLSPTMIHVKTNGAAGWTPLYYGHAKVNYNGLTLRPGIFVGAYGCFTDKRFNAEQLTLSTSAATYPGNHRVIETLTGNVHQLTDSGVVIQTGPRWGYVNVQTSGATGLRVGDRVAVTGYFNPDGTFKASKLEAATTDRDECPNTRSIFGTVEALESPTTMLVKTNGPAGWTRIYYGHARVNQNKLTLRPGLYVGAYGCFTQQRFNAQQITLATSANTYPHH